MKIKNGIEQLHEYNKLIKKYKDKGDYFMVDYCTRIRDQIEHRLQTDKQKLVVEKKTARKLKELNRVMVF